MNKQPARTATQRIDDLERGLMSMFQSGDSMARDLMIAKDALKLLNNKLNAVTKAVNEGTLPTEDVIAKHMIDANIEELKEKVTNLVNQGILKATEETEDRAFVVGREIDENGKVVNPRLQFALGSLNEGVREKIKLAKIGEPLTLEEGKLKFELLEAYSIQAPAPEDQDDGAAKATEGEAQAQSSTNEESAQPAKTTEQSGS